jgi:hypothetical protein
VAIGREWGARLGDVNRNHCYELACSLQCSSRNAVVRGSLLYILSLHRSVSYTQLSNDPTLHLGPIIISLSQNQQITEASGPVLG